MSDNGEGVRESIHGHPCVQALGEKIGRTRGSPLYFMTLLCVAVLMVLLPVVYVLLVGLVGYGVCAYVVFAAQVGRMIPILFAWVVFLPALAGILLLLFMIKPLFAPRLKAFTPQTLNARDEPLLFAYVNRLCDVLGAPRPSRIEINMEFGASAGLPGFWSGFVGGKVVLCLGVPLMAMTTLPGATSVLAHEIGHFAQRGGRRLSYLIRRVNAWFANVVYQRDGWDAALSAESAAEGGLSGAFVVAVARFMIGTTRRILWLLMMTGHLFASVLLRQMEYNADVYSARVVGRKTARDTLAELPAMSHACSNTYGYLNHLLVEGRLPDSMPAVARQLYMELPDKVRKELLADAVKQKTGWFDTHPAHTDRQAALQKLPDAGILKLEKVEADARAGVLFTDFDALCRVMTRQWYSECLGARLKQAQSVTVDAVAEERKTSKKRIVSMQSYLGDLPSPLRPVFPSDAVVKGTVDQLAERLMNIRNQLTDLLPEAQVAAAHWSNLFEKVMQVEMLLAVYHAGIRTAKSDTLNLTSGDYDALNAARRKYRTLSQAELSVVEPVQALAMERLQLAVSLKRLLHPVPVSAEETEDSYDLLEFKEESLDAVKALAMARLRDMAPRLMEMRDLTYNQIAILREVSAVNKATQELAVGLLLPNSRRLVDALSTMRNTLSDARYPYATPGRDLALSTFLIPDLAVPEEVSAVAQMAMGVQEQFRYLYGRLLADFADEAQAVEQEIGLPLIEFPELPELEAGR